MSDDRFDEWSTAKAIAPPKISPQSFTPSSKKFACSECMDGFRVYRIGSARYAFACDCEKGRHLDQSGIPSYKTARNESPRLIKEQVELYGTGQAYTQPSVS